MASHTSRHPVTFMQVARVGVDVTSGAQTSDHRAIKKDDLLSFKWLCAFTYFALRYSYRQSDSATEMGSDGRGFYVSGLQSNGYLP